MVKKKTFSLIGFILGLAGLWPVVFTGAFVLLLVTGGEKSAEFSLEPRSTQFNQLVFIGALALTLLVQVGAVVFGWFGRRGTEKREAGRGFALAAVIAGAAGFLFTALVLGLGLYVASKLTYEEDKLSPAERLAKCKGNQENIKTALGPDMWGLDHPDFTPEDLAELDLSPDGDLVHSDTGVAYIGKEALDCPEDDDPTDVDYRVKVSPDGGISVECADPEGVAAGHND